MTWRAPASSRISLPIAGGAILLVALTVPAAAQRLDFSGFATLAAGNETEVPVEQEEAVARIQVGVDWWPTAILSFHLNLQARTDDLESRDGTAGLVEAYAEADFVGGGSRVRVKGGAFFLPTSLENVDALWENPYAISSSALNTWFGEELRPVGVDVTYFLGRGRLGGTVYRGNETLGALPPVRGWQIGDRWTLLGEELPVDAVVFTSLTAENDDRLGWSARAGWSADTWEAQVARFDNRSDGLLYGDLFNWNTRFDLLGLGWYPGAWTIAAEAGWGPTYLVVEGQRFVSNVAAGYLLVSRRIDEHRATLRLDAWDDGEGSDEALTIAYLARVAGGLRIGGEISSTFDETRVTVQLRRAFSRSPGRSSADDSP